LKTAELIAPFVDAYENPARQVEQWKAMHGGRVVGFLMTDVPEELIHAAGFFPYGITGGNKGLDKADAHLQTWVCSYVRSCFALAVDGRLDYLEGLIVPQTCDTTRMLLDLWNHVRPLPYMEDYRLPRQVGRGSARKYLLNELERMKEGLERFAGHSITTDNLKKSIMLYNHNRQLMRKLFDMHAKNPSLIGNRNLYTVVNGAMVMPRERVNELLVKIVDQLQESLNIAEEDKYLRLVLSGTLLTPLEILDLIDNWGGVVIGDDFQNGYRYIEADVTPEGDPVAALADRQLNRIPSAAYDIEQKPRRVFLTNLAKEKKAHGVIFVHLNFCEPENFDYYDNLTALQKAGFPAIRIESQFGQSTLGQMQTRLQAFLEMIGGEGS